MPDANTIVRDRQLVVRREMDRRGISLKGVSFDSGIPYASIVSYFPGERDKVPATISSAVIFQILTSEALPLDLVSLILPDGFQIVRAPEGIDHDRVCELATEYAAAKNRAHHPDSEAGRDIGPGENGALTGMVMQIVGGIAA
jgi:hypothetical protein